MYTEQEPAYTKQECWAMSLPGHSSLQVVWRWLSIGAQGSEPLLGIGAGLFCVVIPTRFAFSLFNNQATLHVL